MDTIETLRGELFSTLRAVRAGTMPLDTARAINELGKSITDTAKVEVAYLQAIDADATLPFLATAVVNRPRSLEQEPAALENVKYFSARKAADLAARGVLITEQEEARRPGIFDLAWTIANNAPILTSGQILSRAKAGYATGARAGEPA